MKKIPRNRPTRISSSDHKFRSSRSVIPRIQPPLNIRVNQSLHEFSSQTPELVNSNLGPSRVAIQFSQDFESAGPLQIHSSSTRRSLNSGHNDVALNQDEEGGEQFKFLRQPFTICREQIIRKRGIIYFLIQIFLLVAQMVLAELVTSEISQNLGFFAISQMKALMILIGLSTYKLKNCKQCNHISQILFYFAFGMIPLVSIFQLWSCADSQWIQPQAGFLVLDICGAFLCCLVCKRISLKSSNLNKSMTKEEMRKYQRKFKVTKKVKQYCVICFTPLKHKCEVIALPCTKDINHIFHLECGQQWLRTEGRCPVCRKDYKLH